MKNMIKKIGVLILAVTTVLAMSTTAFAATTLDTNGEQGAFATPDTPVSQSKTLVIEKELKVYNVNETTINAPDVMYTYTLQPATVPANASVTDNANKHAGNTAVTVPVKAGINHPTAWSTLSVSWSPSETVTAAPDGASNKKDLSLDFSGIVFTGAGIYRYELQESGSSGYDLVSSGITGTTGTRTRFIDVYVRPATTGYTDGSTAAEWDIYGFTCFYNNVETITDANKTTVPVKTTGFVTGTSDGTTTVEPDRYFTYNVMVSKTVVNDGYGAATVEFPFTVLFTNSAVTKQVDISSTVTGAADGFTDPAKAALSAETTNGILKLKSGASVKYIGIPCGTSVEAYETNVATGVTYKVDTAVDAATPVTDNAVSWGTAPSAAVAQTTKAAYESTKATITPTVDTKDTVNHTIAVTNTLLTISPTGVVLRIAPYALILAAGIVLFLVARRRKEDKEEVANA